jgi:hypothetical protein
MSKLSTPLPNGWTIPLKKIYSVNSTEITELEMKLREINEIKINAILEKNKNFENIHGERITPFFLKMVQGCQHESSLKDICNARGEHFYSAYEQKNYIRSHFADSIKKPQNGQPSGMYRKISW